MPWLYYFLQTSLSIYFPAINIAALALCFFDKRRAKSGGRRVSEKSFVRMAIMGGGAGTLIGFYAFRHKTKHGKLLLSVWIISAFIYLLLALALFRVIK